MSSFPPALDAHLAREVTTICHCWRLTRKDGAVFGFTDHDRRLVVDGTAFEPESGFSASEARDTLGLAVDTVDVEGALSSSAIRDSDVAAALYDGAAVQTYLVNWREPANFALIRSATIGKITRLDNRFVAELESAVHALDRVNGRIVTRRCDAELGDSRCRFELDQPGFTAAGSVAALRAPDAFAAAGLGSFAAGWFSFGSLTWTTGDGAGRTDRIADHRLSGGEVVLALSGSIEGAEAGDSFTIRAGCDKNFATCKAKFSNVLNFRGFPHLPGNDQAYGYVTDEGRFDGAPLVP